MLLFVGLGNPGSQHIGNRHNIGFMVVQAIAKRHTFAPWRRRFQGVATEGTIGAERDWVTALIDTIADNASMLAAGQDASFQNKVHLAMRAKGFGMANDKDDTN